LEKQRPRLTNGVAFVDNLAPSLQEFVAIVVIPKDIAFFDSAGNNMVQGPGGIIASLFRQG
jgi:hypothetical protein